MARVQPGHEVLSLFGLGSKSAFEQNSSVPADQPGRTVTASLLSAFFVVLFFGITLGLVLRWAGAYDMEIPEVLVGYEGPAAYQSGQYIAPQLRAGYLSDAR